jgi:hypothetical protein
MADSLPPPETGPYAYNFFALPLTAGASYQDPVFGATVKRLTKDHGRDDIYARNMWWNADETRYLHRTFAVLDWPDAWDVIDIATGRVTHTRIPFGTIAPDGGFDPMDPDVIWRLNGSELQAVRLQENGTVVLDESFVFGNPLRELGGSINWFNQDGRFFLVRHGSEPSVYLFDRNKFGQGPYANPIDASNTVDRGSYLGLSPDGAYVVGFDSRPLIGLSRAGQGLSWKIDHATRSIARQPTVFWSLCGDHGAFLSASDGRTYMITYNCYSRAGLWRVDVSNNADGLNEAAQQALPNNKILVPFASWNDFGHVSTVARGPLRDWAFLSTEDAEDRANGPVQPWHPYRQEILAVNVLTGKIVRLAHHRSRSLEYNSQPRVSSSWAGAWVGFASNFNQPGVVDRYAIPFTQEAPPPVPITHPVTIVLGGKTYVGTVVEQ